MTKPQQHEEITITDPDADRYNALRLIDWWKPDVVANARVMVLGAGATGNEVLKNLALVGIGHIFVVDYDRVQRANLARSVLYRQRDEGTFKAEAAAKAIKELNPDVKVQSLCGNAIYDVGLGMYRRMNVVIGCVDSRRARLAINRACWKVGRPWVDGGIEALSGQARVYSPKTGACYECTLYDQDYALIDQGYSCQRLAIQSFAEGRIPTTPTSASIIGAVQAQEAIKIIHGMNVRSGSAFVYDGRAYDAGWYSLSVKPDCFSHWSYVPVIELKQASWRSTLAEFMASVREHAGPTAVLELYFEFVVAFRCGICGGEDKVMKPLHQLSYEESLCCGQERTALSLFRLTGTEEFAALELREFGIPPLDILRVVCDNQDEMYFELTADEAEIHFR